MIFAPRHRGEVALANVAVIAKAGPLEPGMGGGSARGHGPRGKATHVSVSSNSACTKTSRCPASIRASMARAVRAASWRR